MNGVADSRAALKMIHDQGAQSRSDLLAQIHNLIAQGSRLFKFQCLGGFFHLLLQVSNESAQFMCGQLERGDVGGSRLGQLAFAGETGSEVANLFDDRSRLDIVGCVVGLLLFSSPISLVNSFLHRIGDSIGVHDDGTFHVAGCPTNGLD